MDVTPASSASRPTTGLTGAALRYGAAGLANSALGWAVIFGLDAAGVAPAAANACGFAASISLGFFLHRRIFSARRDARETARYVASVAAAFALNQLALNAVLRLPLAPAVTHTAGQLAGMATYTLALFALSRWWVFRPERAAATPAERRP